MHYDRDFVEANMLVLLAQSTDQTQVIKERMKRKRNMWWGWTLNETLFFTSATLRNNGQHECIYYTYNHSVYSK